MRMMRRIFRALPGFRKNEKGTVTVEFVLVFPVFWMLFVSVFESGLMMTKLMMLERGLDMTVRAIRLAPQNANITHDAVKAMICANAAIIDNCENVLQVELTPVSSTTWAMPSRAVDCVDRDSEVAPVVAFNAGMQNSVMYIRACVVVDPMFPNAGLGLILAKDDSGGVRLVVNSAFANEPI